MKKSVALKTLGLSEGATEDEIKKAHRKLVIENHPDKFGQDKEARDKAEEKTKLINEARDVLLSGKWDPEYSTSGTPYGTPFNYNPYASSRPSGSAGGGQGQPYGSDPFAGFPFDTFVWTSWDQPTGTADTHGAQGTSNPFASGDPFSTFFGFSPFGTTISPEAMLKEAKASLNIDIKFVAGKTLFSLLLGLVFLNPALALYFYVVLSIGQGIYKRLSFLSLIFVVPLALLAIIFAPQADAAISLLGLLFFLVAVGFDVSNIKNHLQEINILKEKISQNNSKS